MKYQLILGDTIEKMVEIPDGSVDMVLCDLPYGTTACKWDVVIPFEPLWAAYRRVCKKNAAIVLTASQPFTSALVMSNPGMFKYEWVWEKEQGTGFARSAKQPLRKHENVLVFYAWQPSYCAQGAKLLRPRIIKRRGNSNNHSASDCLAVSEERVSIYEYKTKHTLLRFNRDRGHHPTQKPVGLMEYLIKTYTHKDELVLDNTMGSGTTGVACGNLGRRFIGIERDVGYFEIAKNRIEKAYSDAELKL